MKERIEILPAYEKFFTPGCDPTLEDLAQRFGIDLSAHRKRSRVARAEFSGPDGERLGFFLKVYACRSGLWEGWFRSPRGEREARNLRDFRCWGIPAARVVGCGSRTFLGLRRVYDFVMTEEAAGAAPLLDFWTGTSDPADSGLRARLITGLARQVAVLHAHGFCHQDLKWRNLLVRPGEGQEPPGWVWIDCPNGFRSRLPWRRRHGRIKDLATLDKVAKDRCTAEERLAFVRAYLGPGATEPAVRRFAARVVRYRRRRQDD